MPSPLIVRQAPHTCERARERVNKRSAEKDKSRAPSDSLSLNDPGGGMAFGSLLTPVETRDAPGRV